MRSVTPEGGGVAAISESGYINATLFVEWNNHLINNRVLLLLEGHITLKKSASINLGQREWYHNACHNNCLDTSHRPQPLDGSFFKPMRLDIQAVEKWLRTDPGR